MKEIRPVDLWVGRVAAVAGIAYVLLAGLRRFATASGAVPSDAAEARRALASESAAASPGCPIRARPA